MRALTLHQPWAALVASGVKLIENRPMRPMADAIGHRIAIHAGLTFDEDAASMIVATFPDVQHNDAWWHRRRVHGKILATARLVGYVQQRGSAFIAAGATQLVAGRVGAAEASAEAVANQPDQLRWFSGPIGYVLADVRALATPIACRGMPGFWPVPADVEARILQQEWLLS